MCINPDPNYRAAEGDCLIQMLPVQCTMCTLFHTNSAGLLKLGHILKNPKKYFYEHIFFPALTSYLIGQNGSLCI